MTMPVAARRARLPFLAATAAAALLLPALSATSASAAPAPDAEPTTISAGGAFTQVVPDGVCSVNVTLAGAPGGVAISDGDVEPDPDNPGTFRGANGAGGVVRATVNVSAGATLTGHIGSNGSNGGGGGLLGGGDGGTGAHRGGGGGGYSELSFGADLLLLAAGGGGTGGGHTSDFGHGGDGGFDLASGVPVTGGTAFPGGDGTTGQDKGINADPATAPGPGTGGGSAGGLGGTNPRSQTNPDLPGFNWNATPGAELQGGNGGADNFADTGGGGGGGLFGGGGGASTDGDVGEGGKSFVGGGGGGGSSYVADSGVIDKDSVDLAKNRNADGAAVAAFATFEWVMCSYDLAVTKTVVGNPVYEDGATVRYSVVVTNTGADDMAIGDTVSVLDPLAVGGTLVSIDGLGVSQPAVGAKIPAAGIEAYNLVDVAGATPGAPATQRERGLAAGASVEVVYDVVVTGTKPVTNVVTVADRGDQSNNRSEATIAPAAPALALTKSADVERVSEVGQKVTYSFVVKNTGNIAVHDIAIDEQKFSGHGSLPAPSCPAGPVEPDASVTCTTVYTVVAADLTGDALTNTAVAAGATPLGKPVKSPVANAGIVTVKPIPAKGSLATTGGSDLSGYAAGASLLLLAGAALIVARRVIRKA